MPGRESLPQFKIGSPKATEIIDKRKTLREEIRKLQEELARVQTEIQDLERENQIEETKETETPAEKILETQTSRRGFLKILGGAAAAGLAASYGVQVKKKEQEQKRQTKKSVEKEVEAKKEERKKKTPEEFVQEEIKACQEIIQKEKFAEIIEHPYLVSAMYYTDEAVKKIAEDETPQKEILTAIHPLITPKFREGYLKFLEQIYKQKSPHKNLDFLPLDIIDRGSGTNHIDAIDLFIKEGSQIYSMTDGVVVLAENGWQEDDLLSTSSVRGGNTVIIFNPHNQKFYRYAHMEYSTVKAGDVIQSKHKIGIVGHSGINASKKGHGGHIHFEINGYDSKTGSMSSTKIFDLGEMIDKIKAKTKSA